MRVRLAADADWDELWPLLQGMGKVDDAEAAHERFRRLAQSPDHYLPVAAVGSGIAGYAWVQDYGRHLRSGGRTARLHDLYVCPDCRRRGVGRRLFEAVRSWAEKRGVRYLQWQASTSAAGFYRRLGFEGDPCPQPDFPYYEIDFAPGADHD